MARTRYPLLYQINTRAWLTELSTALGRRATLDDIPDAELDRLAEKGFDWLWFLSVWQTGTAGQRISRAHPDWRREFAETLPDLCEEDIEGSGFAIASYSAHEKLGGEAALARLRQRLRDRGLRLLLDFVPNHVGPDHPWVETHPGYFIAGTEDDLARAPANYTRIRQRDGELILACGRDPYFPGWTDTLQLNYANPATQEAMIGELLKISRQCDGVRCDMAMLVLPEVFQRTWGQACQPFWPHAIRRVRDESPEFCLMAEVYWDLEWTLLQQGFDYAYDKRLYDRLREGHAGPVRAHLCAEMDYQNKLVRFLENHDEARAAATFPDGMHEAAALITFLSPGMRFFHDGQFEGRKKRISPHLIRRPDETVDPRIARFYDLLLGVLRQPVVRDGRWQLLECRPAWDGNWTSDCMIAFAWEGSGENRLLVSVNYAPNHSQCRVQLPFAGLGNADWRLQNLLGDATYDRHGGDLETNGLFLDVPPWDAAVFTLEKR